MVNLNNFTQEEKDVKIFNGGNAGRVKNVTVQVVKKGAGEKENAPDYKVNYIDSNGGMVNDAVYYPKDSDTDRQKEINVTRLLNLLHALNPETKAKMLPEFETYQLAVDFLVKQIITASKSSKVNVFVAYGTKNNPQQYLRVRKFNFVEPVTTEDSNTRLRAKVNPDPSNSDWDDVMERIVPTSFNEESEDEFVSADSNDDGLDDW